MRKEMLDYVHRHSEKRNSNLKYDFMPDLLEIIEKPAHAGGKVIIYGIALFFVAALIWAGLAKADVVVTADGYVIPEGNICSVNSNVSGTIQTINIDNGDYVSEGDVLIQLDSKEEEEQLKYVSQQIEICKAENEIYEQILNGSSTENINIDGYSDNCKNVLKSIIEKQKYYELSIEYSKQQSGADSAYVSMGSQENRAEIAGKIADNSMKTDELNAKRVQLEETVNDMKICAPVSGYISGMTVNMAGIYINSTEPLLTIVPDDTPLVVECYVPDKDIADIKCGQEAAVKILAYPYSDYGILKGEVYNIAASAKYVENRGNVYVVGVKILDDKKVDLISGMSGSVEMKLGKRSVLEYLFEPVMNKFKNSLKEK